MCFVVVTSTFLLVVSLYIRIANNFLLAKLVKCGVIHLVQAYKVAFNKLIGVINKTLNSFIMGLSEMNPNKPKVNVANKRTHTRAAHREFCSKSNAGGV
jgi:hypothetical protein